MATLNTTTNHKLEAGLLATHCRNSKRCEFFLKDIIVLMIQAQNIFRNSVAYDRLEALGPVTVFAVYCKQSNKVYQGQFSQNSS